MVLNKYRIRIISRTRAQGSFVRRYLELFLSMVLGCAFCFVFIAPLRSRTNLEDDPRATRRWPRIFCMISTIEKNHHTRVPAVNETWAKHCDEYVFVTNRNEENGRPFWVFEFGNSTLPRSDNKIWLWERVKAMFRRVKEEKLNDFDWFLKADDDSFVVIENLKEFLVDYDPNSPYLVGALHSLGKKPPEFDYMSGGAGYILSREGVNRFVSITKNSRLCNTTSLVEDVALGICMRNAGATFINPQDNQGRGQMFQLNLIDLLHETQWRDKKERRWMRRTSKPKRRMGKNCCSDKLISTHHLDPMEMKLYYYLVYGLKVASRPDA